MDKKSHWSECDVPPSSVLNIHIIWWLVYPVTSLFCDLTRIERRERIAAVFANKLRGYEMRVLATAEILRIVQNVTRVQTHGLVYLVYLPSYEVSK
jgi:hypothetical protein